MRDLPEWLTDEMWWAACDAGMSPPVPLAEANLSHPFVYDREWGVFYVGFGHHQMAMATLMAWKSGVSSVAKLINSEDNTESIFSRTSDYADAWFARPGSAMKSSASRRGHICVCSEMADALTYAEWKRFSEYGILEM